MNEEVRYFVDEEGFLWIKRESGEWVVPLAPHKTNPEFWGELTEVEFSVKAEEAEEPETPLRGHRGKDYGFYSGEISVNPAMSPSLSYDEMINKIMVDTKVGRSYLALRTPQDGFLRWRD